MSRSGQLIRDIGEDAYAMRDLVRESICSPISDVCGELGIPVPDERDPYSTPAHLVPSALYNITPQCLASFAGQLVHLDTLKAWERQIQTADEIERLRGMPVR